MSHSEKEIGQKSACGEDSHELSMLNDTKYSNLERIALVRSMTDRLRLTLDDIRSSVNSERLNALSMVPTDLLPFEINLADGHKVTLMETNPVVTCYDGELPNLKGNVIHVYLRNKGEELPEDFLPPRRMFTVTAETLDSVIPSIIRSLVIPRAQGNEPIPSTSKEIDTSSNAKIIDLLHAATPGLKVDTEKKQVEESTMSNENSNASPEIVIASEDMTRFSNNKCKDVIVSSTLNNNVQSGAFTCPESDNITNREHEEENTCEGSCNKCDISSKNMILKETEQVKENSLSPFSPKFQVIGLVDTGIVIDSESEEGLNNITEDYEHKDGLQQKNTATIVVDKELGDPSDFRSVFLKTTLPVHNKKTENVRKSPRIRKPKNRSQFKSWDDLKLRLPSHSRKGRASKGTKVRSEKIKIKRIIKKIHQKDKNIKSQTGTKRTRSNF